MPPQFSYPCQGKVACAASRKSLYKLYCRTYPYFEIFRRRRAKARLLKMTLTGFAKHQPSCHFDRASPSVSFRLSRGGLTRRGAWRNLKVGLPLCHFTERPFLSFRPKAHLCAAVEKSQRPILPPHVISTKHPIMSFRLSEAAGRTHGEISKTGMLF